MRTFSFVLFHSGITRAETTWFWKEMLRGPGALRKCALPFLKFRCCQRQADAGGSLRSCKSLSSAPFNPRELRLRLWVNGTWFWYLRICLVMFIKTYGIPVGNWGGRGGSLLAHWSTVRLLFVSNWLQLLFEWGTSRVVLFLVPSPCGLGGDLPCTRRHLRDCWPIGIVLDNTDN